MFSIPVKKSLNNGIYPERDEPRLVEVVKLRFFAGLTTAETAAALGVSVPTVERDWRFARTLLYTQLAGSQSDS